MERWPVPCSTWMELTVPALYSYIDRWGVQQWRNHIQRPVNHSRTIFHFPCPFACLYTWAMAAPLDRPLDDRSDALKIPVVTLIAFSSIFVLLRLAVSARKRNFFLLTDHLLWTGHVRIAHNPFYTRF